MTEKFYDWLNQNKKRFEKYGFTSFDFLDNKQSGSNEGSVVVTTKNEKYICQFTIRNNGLIDIEMVSVKSGELDYYIYCKVNYGVNFDNIFNIFFDALWFANYLYIFVDVLIRVDYPDRNYVT